jgi:AcrR family transcriptional regulator
MRFEKGHKEATRRKIVEIASKKFREEGVEAVGIAGLMAAAGLTHGGFYAHFESKEALVREAVDAAFESSRMKQDAGLEALVRSYLRPSHRDNPGQGCVVAALAAEIGRHPEATKAAFTKRLERFVDRIARHLPPDVPETARQNTAMGILSVMIGALQMARAVTEEEVSLNMLEAGIQAALSLAEAAKKST